MYYQTNHGTLLSANQPVPLSGGEKIIFDGSCSGKRARFGMTRSHLDKHTLLAGSTGCGKTTLMNTMIEQTWNQLTSNDVMIIFDSKGDFYSRFKHKKNLSVIGNSEMYYSSSQRWNIFKEICADGFEDRMIKANTQEICKNLFADREKRSNNPFFPNAARDLLASLLIFLIRSGKNDPGFKNEFFFNDKLKELLDTSDTEKLLHFLSFDSDAQSAASYISGGGEQANGVLSEMYSVVRDIFTGVFSEKGIFSVRDFVRKKGGNVLFVEYDLSLGEMLTPVYRLLFDLALKEALGRTSESGNVYLFLDEFRLLPNLQHIDDGVNFGRSLGVKVFAGIQTVEQLFDIYGESRGRSILAGFSNLFLFHTDDPSTLNYFKQRSGQNVVIDQYQGSKGFLEEKIRTGNTYEDWDMISLKPGEAIVTLAFSDPFKYKFII